MDSHQDIPVQLNAKYIERVLIGQLLGERILSLIQQTMSILKTHDYPASNFLYIRSQKSLVFK